MQTKKTIFSPNNYFWLLSGELIIIQYLACIIKNTGIHENVSLKFLTMYNRKQYFEWEEE